LYFLFIILIPILAIAPFQSQDEIIPHWIKKDASWWHQNKISDSEFVNCIKWLVEKRIIPIKYTTVQNGTIQAPPPQIKEIAYFWSTGAIPDKDFIGTIRYLIKNGIMDLSDESDSQMKQDIKSVGQ
jgi:hypothetical protein